VGPLLVGVGAVVALVAAVAFVLTLGGDDDPADTASDSTAAATDDPATTPSSQAEQTTTTTPPPEGPFVQIDSVQLQGEQYLVNFTVTGFQPCPDPGCNHSHFFLNDVEPDNAGANGNPPGDWNLTYDTGSYLTDYGPADLSTRNASQMCSLVADSSHNVAYPGTTTGNCVDLPPAG
jgi:hypothetical protein